MKLIFTYNDDSNVQERSRTAVLTVTGSLSRWPTSGDTSGSTRGSARTSARSVRATSLTRTSWRLTCWYARASRPRARPSPVWRRSSCSVTLWPPGSPCLSTRLPRPCWPPWVPRTWTPATPPPTPASVRTRRRPPAPRTPPARRRTCQTATRRNGDLGSRSRERWYSESRRGRRLRRLRRREGAPETGRPGRDTAPPPPSEMTDCPCSRSVHPSD